VIGHALEFGGDGGNGDDETEVAGERSMERSTIEVISRTLS
jgi:hypothetical protein